MKIKGKYSEATPLYVALLAVGAVLAVVVFFVVLNMTGGDKPAEPASTQETTSAPAETEPSGNGYSADKELAEEMKDAVIKLISDNYTILKLYYIRGLGHKDEPYGNTPEDGYYSVDSDRYTSIDQIETIVDRTFVPEFAEKIKTDPLGYGAIYKTRSNGDLGIIAGFTPMPYDRLWKDPSITYEIEPKSDTQCGIKVTLHAESDSSPILVDAEMIKTDDGWRLTSIIY